MAKVKTDDTPDLTAQRESVRALEMRRDALEEEIKHLNGWLNPHVEMDRSGQQPRKVRLRLLEGERELDEVLDALDAQTAALAPLIEADRQRRIREEDLKRLEGIKAVIAAVRPVVSMNLRVKEDQEQRSAKGLPTPTDIVFFPELLPSTSGHTCRLDILEGWAQKEEQRLNGGAA